MTAFASEAIRAVSADPSGTPGWYIAMKLCELAEDHSVSAYSYNTRAKQNEQNGNKREAFRCYIRANAEARCAGRIRAVADNLRK